MDLEKIMKNKVFIFTRENFFINFRNLLFKLAYDAYLEKDFDLLTDRIEKKENNLVISKWSYITKLIFSKIYISDFSDLKDLDNKQKEDLDKEISNLKQYEIDKFQYLYLKNVCLKLLKKLNYFVLKYKISLINIVQIYCDLCIKEMRNNRNKYLYNLGKKELLFNRNNGINNINKKYFLKRLGNRKKSIKIKELLFKNLLKDDISPTNKNKNKKKENDEVITQIISKTDNSIDLFSKRHNSARTKLLYCNSYTRLFIGETDKESIIQRHLSNILVLKQNNLKVNGSYLDLSEGYLKNLFNNVYHQKSKKLLIDNYLKNTLERFEVEKKYLNEYNKKSWNSSKKNNKGKYKLNNPYINNKIDNQIKSKYIKRLRIENSAKVKNLLSINDKKENKMKNNKSSFLIENLCKELSDLEFSPKKLNDKKIWIKTDINDSRKKKKKLFFRNNDFFGDNFRSLKKFHNNKKNYINFFGKKDLFFNNI